MPMSYQSPLFIKKIGRKAKVIAPKGGFGVILKPVLRPPPCNNVNRPNQFGLKCIGGTHKRLNLSRNTVRRKNQPTAHPADPDHPELIALGHRGRRTGGGGLGNLGNGG
jgi:hypothetical protein